MRALMIGGDARSTWAARALQSAGFETATLDVPQFSDTPLPCAADFVVLPFPSFVGQRIRGEAKHPVQTVLDAVLPDTRVFGGCFGSLRAAFSSRGCLVHDLYGAEPLTTANAVPTAEGAIALAVSESPITLHDAHCLVIGFGRIGKILALKLSALSAHVTVSVRRESDQGLVEAFGLASEQTGSYPHGLRQYDFIFNTVPAPVLDAQQLRSLSPDCTLIDLSSAPYGIAPELCRQVGVACLYASGLPGRFAPKTAGILYARQIIRELESEEAQ